MIDRIEFPHHPEMKDGTWWPIFFHSNFDTPERLVAGVVALVDGQWHLQMANSLERLKCLYGKESEIAIEAIEAGLSELKSGLSETKSLPSLLAVSGLTLGEERKAQSIDAASLCQRWLRAISSLHNMNREYLVGKFEEPAGNDRKSATNQVARAIERDRLSVLVFEDLVHRAPQVRRMFNTHVQRLSENQNSRLVSQKAYVAYDGKRLAANFSTLKAGRHKVSVDIAKRLMWDLEQHRENVNTLLEPQSHEMFLHHPAKDDPQITERQFENVMEVVEMLRFEGKKQEILVKSFDDVQAISSNIIHLEDF